MKNVDGWQPKSLRQLATINYGRSPAGILSDDGEYPVLGTGGAERLGSDYLYEGDSVILGRKGTIDRVHFATGRFWVIDTAYYLSGFNHSLPRWLFYFLQTLDFRKMNEATGVPSLSREVLYKIEVPTPPETEQVKIADVLLTLERALEQTEALIAKHQRLRTGLTQDLLMRGSDEHGNLRSEHTHKFKDSPLGRIPDQWEVLTLAQCAERVIVGLASSTTHAYRDVGIPLIRNQNIRRGYFDDRDLLLLDPSFASSFPTKVTREGDVLTVRTGANVGDTAMVPSKYVGCHTFTTLITSPKKNLLPEYLVAYVESYIGQSELNRILVGAGKENLNVGQFVNFRVVVPPVNEQRFATKCISAVSSHVANGLALRDKLRKLKIGLLTDLLTGRKPVTALLEPELKREKVYASQ